MKRQSGSSSLPPSVVSVQNVLLLLVGTLMHNGSVDAYVVAPPPLSGAVFGRSNGIDAAMVANALAMKRSRISNKNNNRMRLYSNDGSDTDGSDNGTINRSQDETLSPLFMDTNGSSTSTTTTTTTQEAKFGDVISISRKGSSSSSAQFGDVVSIARPASVSSQQSAAPTAVSSSAVGESSSSSAAAAAVSVSDKELLRQRKVRNIGVAVLSVFLAVGNYAYQWTHPVTPIQLLVNMERASAPLSEIGKNSKPTIIDFWAPWCENCRYMAPTLFQVEESYKDRVNFVMVNGDDPNNWPLIEALGVDAIPHMAMIESDGTVDTALIGAVPKEWLSRDIDVLLDNAVAKQKPGCAVEVEAVENNNNNNKNKASSLAEPEENCGKKALPYQMLDVFANRRSDERKLSNVDALFEAKTR